MDLLGVRGRGVVLLWIGLLEAMILMFYRGGTAFRIFTLRVLLEGGGCCP
jgi:hypothetical protein